MTWDPEAHTPTPDHLRNVEAQQAALLREADRRRFWLSVDRAGPVPEHMPHLGKCWVWVGCKNKQGYGQFWRGAYRGGSQQAAHRAAWEMEFGALPKPAEFRKDTIYVLHKCDNPPCIRGTHLFLGTPEDNSQDMAAKSRGRKTKLGL